MTGAVTDTYVAAIQHDSADLDGDVRLVGVVRRPTGWFRSAIDENRPALGPPSALLDETKDAQERLKRQGICDEEAHNAAWEETDFERRYREYLDEAAEGSAALEDLVDLVESGQSVALVCFEGDKKRCHRRILREIVAERIERGG